VSPANPSDGLLPSGLLPNGLLPLWPFQTVAQADAWLRTYRAVGSDGQHRLDAASTALEFTRGALGFTGVDRVISTDGTGAEQFVAVGWRSENGSDLTAAVLRLIRLGTDPASPWVVVGTRGTERALATPGYGERVSGSLTVGGRITGADEALRVLVVGPGGVVLGRAGPVPVGGADQAWSVLVPLVVVSPGAALSVVVSTGGHVADVEWFAITAVIAG
jgi:hypothetical protein